MPGLLLGVHCKIGKPVPLKQDILSFVTANFGAEVSEAQ